MRKVLLATTALVALGGVSAASADISISGYAEFAYNQPSNAANTMASDGGLVVTASTTTDSGLTVTAKTDMKWEGSGINDAYVELKGDFGTVRAGTTDTALDTQDSAFTGRSMSIQGAGESGNELVLIGGDSTAINYYSPSFSGLQVVGSVDEANNRTDIGVSYKIGGITLGYQTRSAATDSTLVGVGFELAGISVQAGSVEHDTNGTKAKASDVGIGYTMGDLNIGAYTAKASGTSTDTSNALGVLYNIGGGASLRVESYSNKVSGTKTNGVYSELRVAF